MKHTPKKYNLTKEDFDTLDEPKFYSVGFETEGDNLDELLTNLYVWKTDQDGGDSEYTSTLKIERFVEAWYAEQVAE